jgi:hypothetical protein
VTKQGFLGPYANTDGPAVVSMTNMAISSKIVVNIGYLQDKPFISILSSREYAYISPNKLVVFILFKNNLVLWANRPSIF